MFALRLVVAFTFLLNAAAAAKDLINLDYEVSFPANSTCISYFSPSSWTQVDDQLVYDGTWANTWKFTMKATCSKMCFLGRFDPQVNISSRTAPVTTAHSYLYDATDNQTKVCVDVPYADTVFYLHSGARSLKSMTATIRMMAPVGSTADDVEVQNQPFTLDGKILASSRVNLTFNDSALATPPVVSGGLNFSTQMNISLPVNTTHFVLNAPHDLTMGALSMSMSPSWPEPFLLGADRRQSLMGFNQYFGVTPAETPIWFSGALDPTIQYTLILMTAPGDNSHYARGRHNVYTLSSIDLYSVKEKPETQQPTTAPAVAPAKSKSIVGPAVGGAIGGLCLLILLIVGFLYIRRRRERERYGKEGDKFQIDTETAVATPFDGVSPPTMTVSTDPTGKSLMHGGNVDNAAAVRNLIRESDGGGLIQGDDEYLPPLYNPSWSAPSGSSAASSSRAGDTLLSPGTETVSQTSTSGYPQEKKGLIPR